MPRILLISLVVGVVVIGLGVSQFKLTNATTNQTGGTEIGFPPIPSTQVFKLAAAIIPHHDLVKEQRREFLKNLELSPAPETVVLVSPNHEQFGPADVLTTDRTWTLTDDQKIYPNQGFIEQVKLATVDDFSFTYEHGIKNILPDIAEVFPGAKIAPIILKDSTTSEAVHSLANEIVTACQKTNCLLLASIDISHYQPAELAEIHDEQTLRALYELDQDLASKVEVDSNPSLNLLISYARERGLKQFTLADHTNSGFLANNLDIETTTHILGYYQKGEIVSREDSLTFTFAGDVMLGREIGYRFQDNFSELFSNLGDRTFWGTDISWVNLEGPVSREVITQNRDPNNLLFNFSSQAISALNYLKLTTVGLANNHTLNQGKVGLETTKSELDRAGIGWHGDPGVVDDQSVRHFKSGGIQVALIGVNALVGTDGLTELISKENANGQFVIVLPHWGAEYQAHHNRTQENLAHAWIDAGADLILGSHPHVIQDAEIYEGKLIAYSLGNFIFDQTFSTPTQQGLIVAGKITANTLTIVPVPIKSANLKPQLMIQDAKSQILNTWCESLPQNCSMGKFELPLN